MKTKYTSANDLSSDQPYYAMHSESDIFLGQCKYKMCVKHTSQKWDLFHKQIAQIRNYESKCF